MYKDLQHRIFDKMAKKAAPKKKLVLSQSHPAYKVLTAPNKVLTLSQQKAFKALNKGNKALQEKETKQDFQKVLKILGIEI